MNGLYSKTLLDLMRNKREHTNLVQRLRVKVMLGTAAMDTVNYSDCPSCWDDEIYTPSSMREELELIE